MNDKKDTKKHHTEETQLDELNELKSKCEEYLNGWKRAKADYENLKKQTEKEHQEFIKFANWNLIMQLIPIYNNFKISFEHLSDEIKNNEWVKGIEQIKKQFKHVLKENEVEEIIPKVGDKFDPETHEAVQQETRDKRQETRNANEIMKVVSCGYKLNGKVIVPAMVIVE